MSLQSNIRHLAAAPGMLAFAVYSPAHPSPTPARVIEGDPSWGPIFDAARSLLEATGQKTCRVVLYKHTVVLQTEGAETAAAALPTGHVLAKSLRRMIRRASRRTRSPMQPRSATMTADASTPRLL